MKVLGIDIGGTKCAVSLGESTADHSIDIIRKDVFPTEVLKGPQHAIDKVFDTICTVLFDSGTDIKDVERIGISCGGPLDSKNGIIMSPPNLPGWDNIHIKDMLEDKYGIKTSLQNDANACALAEWKFGAAQGFYNVIFLTFGTGLGAGFILDGRLYSGTNGMAGEVGHIRLDQFGPVGYGKAGSFEGFCSGAGIAQLAGMKVRERLQMGEKVSFCGSIDDIAGLNAKIVAEAAENGDDLAKEIYRICGNYLGKGLSVLIDILNPQIIVIGSIFLRSQGLLWESAKQVIENETLSFSRTVCKVVPAGLGEKVGDYASLAVALYE